MHGFFQNMEHRVSFMNLPGLVSVTAMVFFPKPSWELNAQCKNIKKRGLWVVQSRGLCFQGWHELSLKAFVLLSVLWGHERLHLGSIEVGPSPVLILPVLWGLKPPASRTMKNQFLSFINDPVWSHFFFVCFFTIAQTGWCNTMEASWKTSVSWMHTCWFYFISTSFIRFTFRTK